MKRELGTARQTPLVRLLLVRVMNKVEADMYKIALVTGHLLRLA